MRQILIRCAPLLPLVMLPIYLANVGRHEYDDPYITYRYAYNLSHHLGFTYNPTVRILSTTTPLYALLLAGLNRIWSNLPRVSDIIGSVCLLLGACISVDLLPARIPAPWRALSGLLLAHMIWPMETLGSEIPLYILLILGTCWCYGRAKPVAAGALAGLATITRPDGLVLFAALSLTYLARLLRSGSRPILGAEPPGCADKTPFRAEDISPRAPKAAAVAFVVTTLPWYLFSKVYFGSFIPITLAVKRRQAHVNGGQGFFHGLFTTLNFVRKDYGNVEFALIGLLIVAGAWALVRRRELPLLPAWALLYIGGYSVLNVRYYNWYYAPLFSAGVWLLTVGLHALYAKLRGEASLHSTGRERTALAVVVAVAISLFFVTGRSIQNFTLNYGERLYLMYRETGQWLATSTPAGSTVAAQQVGAIGYYCHRPIVDFSGLIEPDVSLAPGTSYLDWGTYAIRHYRPDYVALDMPWGGPIRRQPWFASEYVHVHVVAGGPSMSVVVYQRRP